MVRIQESIPKIVIYNYKKNSVANSVIRPQPVSVSIQRQSYSKTKLGLALNIMEELIIYLSVKFNVCTVVRTVIHGYLVQYYDNL